MRRRGMMLVGLMIMLILGGIAPGTAAQETVDGPPFALPFTDPPGPATWLYEQHYGNTTQAFNYGDVWYEFGQGMHFGVDLLAPCGTPVHAIADGVVAYVDGPGFGSDPHNLVLQHPGTGYASLYGHLLETPLFVRGDVVQRGQVIGLSGDPDESCESRPHLHLEIRSDDYKVAYNPLPFFEANWHMLTTVGIYNNNFQQDLDAPYRWMTIESQPAIHFSGNILNNYLHPWPRKLEVRAPVNPPVARTLDPLPENVTVTRTPVALDQWNIGAWWRLDDPDAVYLIDAVPGQAAGVLRQPLDGSPRTYDQPAPPLYTSPDETHTIARQPGGDMLITNQRTGAAWTVDTGGYYPAISPDNTRILYEIVYGEIVPGTSNPGIRAIVSDIHGIRPQSVVTLTNGYTVWLDDHRLLIVRSEPYTANTRLSIVDLDVTPWEPVTLGTYRDLKHLQIAPGGGHIAFTLVFQDDPQVNGVYVQSTEPLSGGESVSFAAAVKQPFFGTYRWRDALTLYTLDYNPTSDVHTLGYLDVAAGEYRALTDPTDLPLRVANGDWSVAPDGVRIVYVDPADYGLYLLTVSPDA